MESLDHRLDFYVDKALSAYLTRQSEKQKQAIPIDLEELARALGNIDIEEREMIPEAAVQLDGGRFKIFLQKNFLNRPGMQERRRFSLAHEIAHTFFFEASTDGVKPVQGGPRGLDLEAACHEGAKRLLVPEQFLQAELKKAGSVNAQKIIELSKRFAVSLEVILRRIRASESFESDCISFAQIRRGTIQHVIYTNWLKGILPPPRRDSNFRGWLNGKNTKLTELEDGSYQISTRSGVLTAKPVQVSQITSLFELKFRPTSISKQFEFGDELDARTATDA